jgi:hypothetical protein
VIVVRHWRATVRIRYRVVVVRNWMGISEVWVISWMIWCYFIKNVFLVPHFKLALMIIFEIVSADMTKVTSLKELIILRWVVYPLISWISRDLIRRSWVTRMRQICLRIKWKVWLRVIRTLLLWNLIDNFRTIQVEWFASKSSLTRL